MKITHLCRIFGILVSICALSNAYAQVETAPALQGKTIRNITIEVREIFDDPNLQGMYQTVNNLKISTRQEVVKRELLFKEGDKYDHFLINESERNLRSLKYLRQVKIVPTAEGDFVDMHVSVQDTWTIIPQWGYSSGTGREKLSVGLAESNLVGTGKRVEALYEEDDKRESIEAVVDDTRVLGTFHRFLGGYFQRSDGDRALVHFGRPFRSLVERQSWGFTGQFSDTVGRLFENGDEDYIFRQDRVEFNARYTFAIGNPEVKLRRISVGYDYSDDVFSQADEDDYEDLDLDPDKVSNDPARLAEDRRYSGPVLAYESIVPDFISMNYIDRFERVEDYNLGGQFGTSVLIAPAALGSRDDALHLSGNRAQGLRFGRTSFMRGEMGVGSRLQDGGFENSVIRAELKYYNVLGPLFAGDTFLGRHTLAASFFIDYGDDLDEDREFLVGGDNALRGYESRTFTGDKRLVLNLEDRVHMLDDVFKLVSIGSAFFLDVGGATEEAFSDLVSDEMYADIGFGLRLAVPRSSGGRVLRVDVALPLREGPDGSDQFEIRVIFAGGQLFDSRLRSEIVGTQNATTGIGFDR